MLWVWQEKDTQGTGDKTSQTFWERYLKGGNEADQHSAVESQEKLYM
jgi:hypothetical protein